MKNHFRSLECPECHRHHDPLLKQCPGCGRECEPIPGFEHQLGVSWPLQIVSFLVGLAGFQIIGTIVAVVLIVAYEMENPGSNPAEFLEGPYATVVTMIVSYGVIAAILCLVFGLSHYLKPLFRSFANWKPIVAGVIGFGLLYGITIGYSYAVDAILVAAGFGELNVNANEAGVRAMMTSYPVLSGIIIILLAPFTEEVAYRVGLFGFLGRLGKPLAYILAAFIFGAVHFNLPDWNDPASIAAEFLNLPSYVGAGAALCFLYDRFGFASSFTAHSLNNALSFILTLVETKA